MVLDPIDSIGSGLVELGLDEVTGVDCTDLITVAGGTVDDGIN